MDLIAAVLIVGGLAVIVTISIKIGEHLHHHKHHHPHHRHPATHGRFVFQGEPEMSVSLNPGQSVSATLQALDAGGNVVPIVGTITFNPTDPNLTVAINDAQNATYSALTTAVAGDYAVTASFIASDGSTVNVSDSINVPTSGVGVATSGSFVFGVPSP